MDEKIGLFRKEFKEKLSLDGRFTVFDVNEIRKKETIIVEVVCSEKHLGSAIRNFHKHYFDNSKLIKLRIKYLPDDALLHNYGISNAGVSPMYNSASNKVEQTSQVIFGESFDVLEASPDFEWYRIRLHTDGYIGWVNKNPITLTDKKDLLKYHDLKKVEVIVKFADIYCSPDTNSNVLRGVFLGAELSSEGKSKGWFKIKLPDGKSGYIEEKQCRAYKEENENPGDLLKYAETLLGVPYIWGGRSPFGIDCSAYTQLIYKMCGFRIPRDSGLQIKVGEDVGTNFKNFKLGDLLFFGNNEGRVTHVAMFTGKDKEFIHASGFVKINSLNKDSKLFDERLSKMFFGARRIINI